MPVAELAAESFLLALAVLGVCALVDTAIKKMWLLLGQKQKPQTSQVRKTKLMSKNTSPSRTREEIRSRLEQVRSELDIFKQVNAPQPSIDLMTARVSELEWVLQEAN